MNATALSLTPDTATKENTRARLYTQIARAVAYVEKHHFDQPSLDDIARHAGMSPDHLQRTFADWAGISPKKFLKALTLEDAKARLRASESVLDAAFDAGLSGPGRLHDLFVSIDAVTPGEFKSRGDGMTFRYGFHPSPFGDCLIAITDRGLTGLSFVTTTRTEALTQQKSGWDRAHWVEETDATQPYADAAFNGPAAMATNRNLRLLLRGSPFRVKVWEGLLRTPEGAAISYGDFATRLGRPGAARAVAGAVAGNLIGYVIPCHRVIRDTGVISGYRWDPLRKAALLGMEGAQHMGAGAN